MSKSNTPAAARHLEKSAGLCKSAGIKRTSSSFAVGFHSGVLRPITDMAREGLGGLRVPNQTEIVHRSTVSTRPEGRRGPHMHTSRQHNPTHRQMTKNMKRATTSISAIHLRTLGFRGKKTASENQKRKSFVKRCIAEGALSNECKALAFLEYSDAFATRTFLRGIHTQVFASLLRLPSLLAGSLFCTA